MFLKILTSSKLFLSALIFFITSNLISQNQDFKIQHIEVDVPGSGTTLTAASPLFSGVASLNSSFIIISNNRRNGAGPNGLTSTIEARGLSCTVYFQDINTIVFSRGAGATVTTRVNIMVVEYIGPVGGVNEFIVRHRGLLSPSNGVSPQTQAMSSTPTNIDKCIPFYSVQTTDTANGGAANTLMLYCSGTNTLNYQRGGAANTVSARVEVVEFTGSNWSVGHGDSGTLGSNSGTITLNSDATGTGGVVFDVGSFANAFIWHTYKGDSNSGANEAIADNYPVYTPRGTTQVDWTFHNNHGGVSERHFVHVLVNPDMKVTRFSDTSNTAGETIVDISTAALTNLQQSIILGSSYSSGNGTAYGRGWRNYYLKSLTQAAHWSHRSGNTMLHELQIIDFAGLSSNIDFDGLNDFIDYGDNHDLTAPFSMEAWVLQEATVATGTIISKRNFLATSRRGYHLVINNNRPNLTWYNNAGTAIISISSPFSIVNNKWYHIAATFNGTTAKLYVDGLEVASSAVATPPTNGTEKFLIGAMYDSSTPTIPKNYFNGFIDEIRIWNTALTVQQLREMMNQEIEQNGTAVKGKVIPLDISGGLLWSNLKGYYTMNDNTANDNSGNIIKINGSPKNITLSQQQTAPLPYKSNTIGNWDANTTWLNGTFQNLPNSNGIDASTKIDWNIVETNHNVDVSRNIKILGLKNSSNTLSVNASNSLEISSYLLLNGVLDLVGESQLIQSTSSVFDDTSTGYLERDQQGEGNTFRYNNWSLPVYTATDVNGNYTTIAASLKDGTDPNNPGAILFTTGLDGAIFPLTLSTAWMYKYANLPDDSYSSWNHIGSTGKVYTGEGYLMKGTGSLIDQNYVFIGKPNNGTINLTVNGGFDYLVGNPYPSAIDANQFILDNSPSGTASIGNGGALYFWEHYGGDSHNLADYQAGYATYSLGGGVPASAHSSVSNLGAATKTPGRYIAVAQGFFVVGDVDGGQIQFNNGQRIFVTEGTSSTFMKGDSQSAHSSANETVDIRPRYRIGFDASKISHRQLLLTIDEKASTGIDWGYDAEMYEVFEDDMYWILEDKKYAIQATNSFGLDTELPFGIQTLDGGLITIKVDQLENVDENISVYIKDNFTGLSHKINNQPFEINLEPGVYNSRFVLVSKTEKALADEEENLTNEIIVFMNNKNAELQIQKKGTSEIVTVKLINYLGQNIKSWNTNLDKNFLAFPVNISSGVYMVQINTTEGNIVKKIIVE